ncbi:IS1 family transposase [Raoultella ornithinolytica]
MLALFTAFIIGMITSDGWGSYAREVLKDKGNTPTPAINTRPLS